MTEQPRRYLAPGVLTQHVFNRTVAVLTRCGISLMGSRVLTVVGRTSGQPRSTPVNLLTIGEARYLVAPRGETQWVRNLRAAGNGTLTYGRHAEPFTAVELSDAEKPPVLREYIRKWKWEVGYFLEGLDADSDDAAIAAAAPGFPAFRIDSVYD
ncbi:nitroreductase family deazaflavin-dependent oxidoreductase [Spongisporangium articulatum]|uniref:Nitroreductase family deazaflavin-dependent oxidoreductase n=1 Tax=Spongisporangium articulatum TaxID=3362603 RepID=A0ABW8ASJ9_9ACTN